MSLFEAPGAMILSRELIFRAILCAMGALIECYSPMRLLKQARTSKTGCRGRHGDLQQQMSCLNNVFVYDNDNDNDNVSNFIAMNYIDHIKGDVQASSWKRNELVFVYIHLHSGIVSTFFSRISMYDTKNKIIMHYSSPTMQFLNLWQRGQEAWAYGPQYLSKWSST